MKLLLATTNQGKAREITVALCGLPLEIVSLSDIRGPAPPAETGTDFPENALLKARHYCLHTGLPTLADDSGLCVEALGGAPGVNTARLGRNDAQRIARVLEQLRGLPNPQERRAYFACALCLFHSPSEKIEVEGRAEGWITLKPHGDRGFGLDPIFFHPPSGQTFAELSLKEKNRVSHRAQALRKLRQRMERAPWSDSL